MPPNDTTTGEYLRELRDTTSQRDLAALIGSSDAAIAHVETGSRPISADMADRVASALRLTSAQRAHLHYLRLQDLADRTRRKARRELARIDAEMSDYAVAAGITLPGSVGSGSDARAAEIRVLDNEIRLLEEQLRVLRAVQPEELSPDRASSGSPRRGRH